MLYCVCVILLCYDIAQQCYMCFYKAWCEPQAQFLTSCQPCSCSYSAGFIISFITRQVHGVAIVILSESPKKQVKWLFNMLYNM